MCIYQHFIYKSCQLLTVHGIGGKWMKYAYGALVEWYCKEKLSIQSTTCLFAILSTTELQRSLWWNPTAWAMAFMA
jgi:hypothetical protein